VSRSSPQQIRDRKNQRERRRRNKVAVLAFFGGVCSCIGCDVKTAAFLVLDHRKGRGCAHRKQINRRGSGFILWVLQQIRKGKGESMKKILRLLCGCCHQSISSLGYCVHENDLP